MFGLDLEIFRQTQPEASLSEAYADIHDVLASRGFKLQHSGVYFGTHDVTAVDCVLATQELAANLDWFAASVKSIRMLRIEENTDLASAITIQNAVTAGLSGDQSEKPLRKRMSAWR